MRVLISIDKINKSVIIINGNTGPAAPGIYLWVTGECFFSRSKAVGNGKLDVYGKLFKLWGMVSKMVLGGIRDPEIVAEDLRVLFSKSHPPEGNIYNRLFAIWATIGHLVNFERTLDPRKVAKVLQEIVDLCVVRVRATDGKATLEDNSLIDELLEFSEDRDFGEAISGSPTLATRAAVHKMLEEGTYRDAFIHHGKLEDLCWQESQIVAFAEDWSSIFNNGKDSRETHFLCKRSKGFCVARIGTNENHRWGIHRVYFYGLDDEPQRETCDGEQDLLVVIPHRQ